MTSLYTVVTYQTAPDVARSTDVGVLTYLAPNLFTQPSYQAVFDLGGSNNSAATPFPIFTGATDARAYFDSLATSAIIPLANAQSVLTSYSTLDVESVDPSTFASLAALAVVSRTGSYLDLTNTPVIPAAQVNSDWTAGSGIAQILNKPSLATVATSGLYTDLTGKPSLATVATSGAYTDLTGRPSLATVATTGVYSDLTGKPTVPVVQAYEGTTQRLGAFPIFAAATVASGVAVFNLTADGTSGGTALFPNAPIQNSVNVFVSDATASYQMSGAWSNSNKTLTVTTNKLTTANILTGLLGQAAANGAVVKLQVWGY